MLTKSATRTYRARYQDIVNMRADGLEQFRNAAHGETVFCVGCGPSLLRQDAGLLRGKSVVLTNAAHRWFAGPALASVVTDTRRLLDDLHGELSTLSHPVLVGPSGWRHEATAKEWMQVVKANVGWIPLRGRGEFDWTERGKPRFFEDLRFEHCGRSVIFAAVQLAVFAGARRVVLLGVDMDYSGPQKHFTTVSDRRPPPDIYQRHARPAFELFRDRMTARGVELLNATDGGRVDVLQRVSLEDACRLTY